MTESWPAFINTLLLAWLTRTAIILWLAIRNRRCERMQAESIVKPSKESNNQALISIIIPAFNEKGSIGTTLLSCIHSDYANKEIIIVDDGSTDGTGTIAKKLADNYPAQRINVLSNRRNLGKTEALNLGLEQASGEIIVTLDADTYFETNKTLTALAQPLITRSDLAATTANLKIANPRATLSTFQAIEYAKIIQTIKRAQSQTNAILILPGALSAFKTASLRAIGGFSKTTLAEDADATMALLRQGHHLCLNTSACGFTAVPTSVAAFIKQRIRWRIGQWQCLWKHRSLFNQSPTTSFFLVDIIATNCMTAATPFFILISLWQIIQAGEWQPPAWATGGFITTDILVTAITARLDPTFRPTPRSYVGSLLFFTALSPWITWLSLTKLLIRRPIIW